MKASDRGYFTPLSFDLRVRERMIAAGVVTPTDIQQYLAGLPDHESQSENLGIPQPALNTPQPPAPAPAPAPIRMAAPAPSTLSHVEDDEDDDEDDDDDLATSAPAEEPAAPVEAAPPQTIAVGEPSPSGSAPEASSTREEAAPVEAAPSEAAMPALDAATNSEETATRTEEQPG